MENLTTNDPSHNPKIDFFKARCEARAQLWATGQISLHEAVDVLQHWAAEYLLGDVSQDEIQKIMAQAFEGRSKP